MKSGAIRAGRLLRALVLLAAAAAGWAGAATTTSLQRAERRPNVVVIVGDDLGYGELGCYGGREIPTPNLDSIAREGARFTNGYVSCPVCAPTRAGLLTGRYQQRFGFEQNPGPAAAAAADFGLPRGEKTLAERLKAAGYVTGMVGKWHLGYREGFQPPQRGFDDFFGFLGGAHPYLAPRGGDGANPILRGTRPVQEPEYLTDAFAREAVAFIERNRERPFFLYLPFNAVHGPLQATAKYLARCSNIQDEKRRTFAAMLTALDDSVGQVLHQLRATGLEEDTLVLFTGDNGGPTAVTTCRNDPLGGFKGQVLEGGIRVPFMARWKGRIPPGQTIDAPAIALDFTPTALDAARIPPPADPSLDGRSLLPLLSGRSSTPPHPTLYWRFGDQAAIRQGDWKLVMLADAAPALYNLAQDVGEKTNLAGSQPERVRQLKAAYDTWNAALMAPRWGRGARSARRPSRPAPAARKPGLRFQDLDRDRDGKLTPEEVSQPRRFQRMDRDRDGVVTPAELDAFNQRRPPAGDASSGSESG